MAFLAPMGAGFAATAGTIGQVLGAIGTVASFSGSMQQARAAQAAAEYNARAAKLEAASKEALQRKNFQRQLGNMRASIGKSGATSAGTPLMVLAESAAEAELDAINTRTSGQQQADIYRTTGRSQARAYRMQAGTSLLTGASKLF